MILIVTAHPDDETIYFGGLLLANPGADVVCITDGNFAEKGAVRQQAFHGACGRLGVRRSECWSYPDNPVWHLPVEAITARLTAFDCGYRAIYTHSPHGEYGHINHMDVSLATIRAFGDRTRICADRLFASELVTMDFDAFARKMAVLREYYASEIDHAWKVISLSRSEGFAEISLAEAEAIHEMCTGGEAPDLSVLRLYAHLAPFLAALARQAQPFSRT